MVWFPKGCKVPDDIDEQIKVSNAIHGKRLKALPKATQSSYDCVELGYVVPIKDQKNCGCCYVFSGTGAAESAAIIGGLGTASTLNWSEQSSLDCGNVGGCEGGWPFDVLTYIRDNGIANTSDYPYLGSVHRCKSVAHPNKVTSFGYVGSSEGVPPVQDIKNAMLAHGPISIAVAADDSFANYSPGTVFKGSGSTSIDHAVILTGWQDDSSVPGGGYWKLRNSWNTSWGNQGYMNIAYGANEVGYGAVWVVAGSTQLDWTKI